MVFLDFLLGRASAELLAQAAKADIQESLGRAVYLELAGLLGSLVLAPILEFRVIQDKAERPVILVYLDSADSLVSQASPAILVSQERAVSQVSLEFLERQGSAVSLDSLE